MNNINMLPALVGMTLRRPRDAAAIIRDWQFGRDVLWSALALVAVINTFLILLLIALTPPDFVLPGYFNSPLALFLLLAGVLVIYVNALFWVGRAMGGTGDLGDLLAMIIWLQALRAAAQFGIVVVTLLMPPLGLLASLVVAVWGLWIFLNFVMVALHLPTALHALGVVIAAAVALVLGLGVFLTLIGLVAQGSIG